VRDTVNIKGFGPVDVTCIDNGMPLVIVNAADLTAPATETVTELNKDTGLKARLEALRISCGKLMGLGDVTAKNYPKMTLVSPPAQAGPSTPAASFRTSATNPSACWPPSPRPPPASSTAPWRTHVATARQFHPSVSVEHPSGEFTVQLAWTPPSPGTREKSALLRTARLIMAGDVMVPAYLWSPLATNPQEH
jgi:4-oxalomesaconate tautomerase